MSNNTLLIVNAPKKIKKLLSRNPKYIFYDNWCFSQFDIEKKENSFLELTIFPTISIQIPTKNSFSPTKSSFFGPKKEKSSWK